MAIPLNILIIEDSEDDLFMLLHELRKAGYSPEYLSVCSAESMRRALASREWDVVTSDYNMPGFSVLGALEILKESGLDLPFIVVSGKIGEDQAVATMKAGAHDYVMKQNLSRLAPAIEREIREAGERQKRREAEVALKRQFSQLRTIFDAMTAIVYVADMESYELLYMNQYAIDLFGGSFEGKLCYTVVQSGQSKPCEFCTNHLLVKDGVVQERLTYDLQNTRNGRWYQCSDRAIEWTDGKLVRLQIAVDITELKQLEQTKDEMLSAVSHEMRTPLTAMLGFSEFLLNNQVDADKQREIIETIYHETERLNELIGSFLDMQRLKNDSVPFAKEPLSVKEILTQAAKLYAINKKHCRVEMICPDDLPKIIGDSAKLHQVMINLLSNACKYSPEDSLVTIGAEQRNDEVIFFVEDEGIGIPAELREKVFEKFYRIDNSDKRKEGGTGIGLALVKKIVTAHGGRVWIEANSPAGSRFKFALHVA
jgi:signal transduction histidine kinase/FixJ family two-component response regulator